MKNSTKMMLATLFLGGGVITANAVEVVETLNLDYSGIINSDYIPGYAEFDSAKVMELLGIDSLDEADVISLDAEGTVLDQTANNGYWYNEEGDVCFWGDGSVWFIEYEEGNVWNIGNFPGASPVDGKCNIGFSIEDKAVIFEVSISLNAEEIGDIDIVKEYNVTYSSEAKPDYETGYLEFDGAEVASLLGCDSLDDARVISLDEDGEILSMTGNNGYWYNYDGEVCNWGNDSAWFVEYHGDSEWTIGNFPDLEEAGGVCNIGFLYDNKIVLFIINVYIGIEPGAGVETLSSDNGINEVYNLQGTRVDVKNMQSLKGLYIINGKKVILK